MSKRFIVKKNDLKEENDNLKIYGSEVKHIQVLRYNIGDEIVVNEYLCKILKMTKDSIVLEKICENEKNEPPTTDILAFQTYRPL